MAFVAGKIVVLLLFFFISNVTDAQTWDCDCNNRKEITLDNSTGAALTNYQIRIDLSYETAMNSDFSNIRFTTSDGSTVIHHWIETYTASTSAVVWVKVPSIAASTSTSLYLYYGGSSCTTTSTASDVFVFYDDFSTFSGWTIYGSGDVEQNTTTFSFPVGAKIGNDDPNGSWKSIGTTIDNFRLITREIRTTNGVQSGGLNRYGVENSDFDGYNIIRNAKNGGGAVSFGYERRNNGGGGNANQTNLAQPQGTWFRTELRRCQSTNLNEAILYSDSRNYIGGTSGSISAHNYSNFNRVTIRGGHDYYIDFMAVANYTCNEPTVSVGAEEDGVTADFSASTTTVGVGNSIVFTDNSTGSPNSWSWTFTGGTPTSSTLQNPAGITYNTVGNYDVSLTATNNCSNSDVETKTSYITVQDYCSSSGNTDYADGVTLVNFNTINNATGKTAGYNDYTSQSTDVVVGNSYNLTVNINTDGNYTNHAMVWIDWSKDGDFLDAGEEYDMGVATNVTNGATSNSPLSVTIPASASLGSTRMRVSTQWNAYPSACETDYDGEVEDYSINICKLPDVPTVTSSANTTCLGDNIILNISGNLNSAAQWVIYTGSCGGTQIGTTTTSSFPINNVSSTATYFVRGEGSCFTAGSCGSTTVTVNPLPTATISGSTSICAGGSADLVVTFTGTSPWDFEYTVNGGAPISVTGETNNPATYTFSPATTTTYEIVSVTDANCTNIVSETATITVNPVSVGGTATVADPTICPNNNTTISLASYTGTIQWQQSADGTSGWANVTGGSGATTDNYTTANLSATTYYRAEVTSGACPVGYSNTVTVTAEDTEDPTITCPTNVTVNPDAGLCTASGVALGTPTTSDNCNVASVTNNSSEPYSMGNTVVTWAVTDDAGNTATCNQTVTVEPATIIDIAVVDLGNSCQSGETGSTTTITWDVTLVQGSNSWTYDYTINDGSSDVQTGTNVSATGNITISYVMNNATATDKTYTITLTNVKDNCGVAETNTGNNSDAATLFGVPGTGNIIPD